MRPKASCVLGAHENGEGTKKKGFFKSSANVVGDSVGAEVFFMGSPARFRTLTLP